MVIFRERCFFRGARLQVELHDDGRYRLAWGSDVVYEPGTRAVRGRRHPYRLRSVEQLRYDFERDVAALGGALG